MDDPCDFYENGIGLFAEAVLDEIPSGHSVAGAAAVVRLFTEVEAFM
jgi:hypothetical protein